MTEDELKRAGKKIKPPELRAMLDSMFMGLDDAQMMKKHNRGAEAIRHLINYKIASSYTQHGRRTPKIDHLAKVKSKLPWDRKANERERLYIRHLQASKRSVRDTSLIMAMAEQEVRKHRMASVFDQVVEDEPTKARQNGVASPKKPVAIRTTEEVRGHEWARTLQAVRQLLHYVGEDPDREGLRDTPERVLRSYEELFSGYHIDPKDVLKVFKDGACDEMVLVKDLPFTSLCEHHMLPFTGRAHIAYIPKGQIVGLSKMARLLDVFARRLQVQERLTEQITQAIMEHVKPRGAACVIEAQHACMMCRGVKKHGSTMVTSSLAGRFRQVDVRQEFLHLIRKR